MRRFTELRSTFYDSQGYPITPLDRGTKGDGDLTCHVGMKLDKIFGTKPAFSIMYSSLSDNFYKLLYHPYICILRLIDTRS